MTTDFLKILKPILVLGKVFGLINISYTFGTTGLLILNTNSSCLSFLELTRTFMLALSTCILYDMKGMYYVQRFRLIKFWTVIIASRLSQLWIIK